MLAEVQLAIGRPLDDGLFLKKLSDLFVNLSPGFEPPTDLQRFFCQRFQPSQFAQEMPFPGMKTINFDIPVSIIAFYFYCFNF